MYDADSQPKLREQPKKIDITQPDGPGFEVEGNLISWEGWQVRASVNPDEGPVLHQLSLDGRPILHRVALSDMVVPYEQLILCIAGRQSMMAQNMVLEL